MPDPIVDFNIAKAQLVALTQPEVVPTLTTTADGEVETALKTYQRATLWSPATVYRAGNEVQPTPGSRTGRRYVCTQSGTSGAIEPDWPDGNEGQVTDGTAAWREAGIERDLWDIRAAAHECWLLKMAKASAKTDIATDDTDKSASQLFEHCKAQAALFAPVGF